MRLSRRRAGWFAEQVLRRQDCDCREASEIRGIQCQDMRQAVPLHGGDQPRVVCGLALDPVIGNDPFPARKNGALVSMQCKQALYLHEVDTHLLDRQPKAVLFTWAGTHNPYS